MLPRAAWPPCVAGRAVCVLVLVIATAATPLYAGPWALEPGGSFGELRAGFFSADDYHDENGNRRVLAGGGEHEERSLLSYSEFGWKKRLSFRLGIPVQSVTRRPVAPGPVTTTGFGNGLVGFRYNLSNGGIGASLELDWLPPLSYERDRRLSHQDSIRCGDASGNGDSLDANCARQLGRPVQGDGQQDAQLALHVGAALPAFKAFVQASGGYRYRFEGPVDQLIGSADAGVWLMPSLLLAGSYVGHMALGEGERATNDADRNLVGGKLLLRVDEAIDVYVATLHTAMAKNALHTDEVFVGMSFKQTQLHRYQGFLGGTAAP